MLPALLDLKVLKVTQVLPDLRVFKDQRVLPALLDLKVLKDQRALLVARSYRTDRADWT